VSSDDERGAAGAGEEGGPAQDPRRRQGALRRRGGGRGLHAEDRRPDRLLGDALYFHFADRRALLRELCDHDFRAFAAELPKVARIKDPVERLRRAGQTYVQFAMEHPGQYRFMFMTPAGIGPEESTAEQGNPEQDAYAFLRACVAEAIAAGRLRPEIKDVEHGLVSLHIAKGRERWVDFRPIKRSADVLIDAILRGLTR
jgi:AcrR family transcriptional regulator